MEIPLFTVTLTFCFLISYTQFPLTFAIMCSIIFHYIYIVPTIISKYKKKVTISIAKSPSFIQKI